MIIWVLLHYAFTLFCSKSKAVHKKTHLQLENSVQRYTTLGRALVFKKAHQLDLNNLLCRSEFVIFSFSPLQKDKEIYSTSFSQAVVVYNVVISK